MINKGNYPISNKSILDIDRYKGCYEFFYNLWKTKEEIQF